MTGGEGLARLALEAARLVHRSAEAHGRAAREFWADAWLVLHDAERAAQRGRRRAGHGLPPAPPRTAKAVARVVINGLRDERRRDERRRELLAWFGQP